MPTCQIKVLFPNISLGEGKFPTRARLRYSEGQLQLSGTACGTDEVAAAVSLGEMRLDMRINVNNTFEVARCVGTSNVNTHCGSLGAYCCGPCGADVTRLQRSHAHSGSDRQRAQRSSRTSVVLQSR